MSPSILSALETKPEDARPITQQVIDCLNVWQRFVDRYPKGEDLPTRPVWSMEFGATYPYESETPHAAGLAPAVLVTRAVMACDLGSLPRDKRMLGLPSHARVTDDAFPDWKIEFIRQNREIYRRNRAWIDKWIPEILAVPVEPSEARMELQGRRAGHLEVRHPVSGVRRAE